MYNCLDTFRNRKTQTNLYEETDASIDKCSSRLDGYNIDINNLSIYEPLYTKGGILYRPGCIDITEEYDGVKQK